MMAAALRVMSSTLVAQPEMLIRIAGRALPPEGAQCGPDLDLPGPLGRLRSVVHRLEPGVRRQVARHRGETAAQVLGPPDEGNTAVVGDIEPFVPVGRPRIGVGEPGRQVSSRRIRQRPQSEGCVHVHPGLPRPGPRHDVTERIERPGVHLAGLGADDGGPGDAGGQPVGEHPALIVGRDAVDPVSAQAHHPERLDHGGVRLRPHDHRQLRGAEQPVGLHVPAGPGQLLIAGGGEGRGVGHGAPGDERGGGPGRQAEQLSQPAGDDLVQPGGDR
jgi:hypothetical protein